MVIRCKGKLWRRLGGKRRTHCGHEASLPGVMLGSWAAKVFECDARNLVLALNERTYLTIVFPFVPRERFSAELANALSNALRDLGIPERIARAEAAAAELMPLGPLDGGELADVLDDLQFFCEMELDYHTDLRVVQRNLNDVPHPNRDPCVPLAAVRELFEGVTESPAWLRLTG
jgi:hypothetical protein